MAQDDKMMASTFFKQFSDEANYDRLLKGFSEVIHLREQTTFANRLKRKYAEQQQGDPLDQSGMKDNDLLNYIDRHKIDIMKLLEANLERITEFQPGSSLVSKLTAEQNVERVIDKLKDHNIIELGKLLRPNHRVNGVYLPPNLRNMVEKRRSKSHVKEPERPHLDLDELEQILEVIGLLKRSESVEAVTMKPQDDKILVNIAETPMKRAVQVSETPVQRPAPQTSKVNKKTSPRNSAKDTQKEKPSAFAYIVAKAPGTQAYDEFINEAQIKEKEAREQRIMKEYSLNGDEKIINELLDSDAISVASSLIPKKHIEKPNEIQIDLTRRYSIRGSQDPFRNSHGEFQIDRPGLQAIMKDAESRAQYHNDIDNSEEDDIDDDMLKARIKQRKSKQRELRNQIQTTLEAAKQVLRETETVKSLIKYEDAIDLGIDLNVLQRKQEEIRRAMQVNFDDEADIKRAMQAINDMKVRTEEEFRGTTGLRTLPEEVRQSEISETLSSISEIMTPVIGHKYNRSTAEGKEPKYRSTAEGKDPIAHPSTHQKTVSKDKHDSRVRESFAKTSAMMKEMRGEGSVFDETESLGAETMPLPIELEQMSQLTEQVDEAFLQECITELKQFIEEQIRYLTRLPDEVLNPAPSWPAEMNSSVGKELPKFKASFIGHLYQIKAKRDLYPSRLKSFNRGKSTKAAMFNELQKLKEIYDSVYKVRTDRSQAASFVKQRSPHQIQFQDRPTPLEHLISEWNPISISRIEGNPIYRFDQTLFANSQTQSPITMEIDAFKRISERTLVKTIQDNENDEGSYVNVNELGQHESQAMMQHQGNSVGLLLTNTVQSSPTIKMKGFDDTRKLIKLKYDQSVKSPVELSQSSQHDNTIDIYAQVIEVSGQVTQIPATAENQINLANNESFDHVIEHNLTSGQQSPIGTGNWPQMNYRPQLQSDNSISQPQKFEPEAMRRFKIEMDELNPSLNSDLSQKVKQIQDNEAGRFTRDPRNKKALHPKFFDFPTLKNEPDRANLQSILSNKNQHYGAQHTKQREILQLILNNSSYRDEIASTRNLNEGNNVGLNILNSTIKTGTPAATQQSFNLLSEMQRKQQPIKGLAKLHERKQSLKLQNKDGMILIGELKHDLTKKHLSRNGSADTIIEEQPGISEKKVGPSTHQFNSPEYESGVSNVNSKLRLVENKLKQMSPKYALGSPKRSQIVAQVNTSNFKVNEGHNQSEMRPPDTQSMKDLPIHNEDLTESQIIATVQVENQQNENKEGQTLVAKSSTKTLEVNKLYQTLAKMSVGSSVAESSGLTQFEMFQQHYLKKKDDDSRAATRFLVTPIPFKPIALENYSMQPLSQSITKKLRSTTLQHSILVQRDKQMRKMLAPRHNSEITHNIEIEANQVVLKPKITMKMIKDMELLEQTNSMPQPILRIGKMLHNDLHAFSSGESEGDMFNIQTQEIRAVSQLENPLLAMNDLDTLITVVDSNLKGNLNVPLNHHSTAGTLKLARSPVLQNSKSPSSKFFQSPMDKNTLSQDINPITLITKAEHMVANEGSPRVTPKASKLSLDPQSNPGSPRNKQVNSYKQGVLFGFPLTTEQLEVTALEGHFRSVTVLLPHENDSQAAKSTKQVEPAQTLYKPQKSAKKKAIPSVGKSTLMDGFLFESPLSLLPLTKPSPFSRTMIKALEDNFSNAAEDSRMPPILTNQKLRQTQFSGNMGTTFVSARNWQKSENRIANNFQVSIKNTRNADGVATDGAKTQLFKQSDQKKLKLVQFGNDQLPPIEPPSDRTSKIGTVIKPLKAGLNKFTLQPPNPRSSIGATVASSFNRSNQFQDPTGRQSPKIQSGTVVLVEKIDVKSKKSKDKQILLSPSPRQSNRNIVQENDPQRDTKLLLQADEKPLEPAPLRNHGVSSQTTLQHKEGTKETQNSPFISRGIQNFDIDIAGGEILTGKPSQVEILPIRSRENSSDQVTAVGPWVPMDTKQYITIYDKLGAKMHVLDSNYQTPSITYRSVWLDNEAFTGFDLKKKQKQQQGQTGIQFQLQGQAPPIAVKKKKQ